MPTCLVRSIYNVRPRHQGGVITIGNFDGVHLGHQALLSTLKAEADKRQVPSTVIIFEPHPFEYFAKENQTVPRLTRLREKFRALEKCGVDNVLVLPFNQALARQSPSEFVAMLATYLKPQHILIGDDFRFGYQRQGDFDFLKSAGESCGFSVAAMPTYLYQGERVSSTRVRQALREGDHALVEQLLGRPYTMLGRVRGGDQLGRQLGFPTANIHLHRKLTPIGGIYIVYMHGIASHPLPGVANVGIRPTVDGTRTLLEVHLLDFNQEIYGRYVEVEFCEKLRAEERYPNLELLKEQIAKDVVAAREYFKKHGVL